MENKINYNKKGNKCVFCRLIDEKSFYGDITGDSYMNHFFKAK